MFDLLSAKTPRQRIRELRKFITFWYGRSKRSYTTSPADDLPLPLKLFLKSEGGRPFLHEPTWDTEFFYEGAAGHHLLREEQFQRDGNRLKFFSEYQGDFSAFYLVARR